TRAMRRAIRRRRGVPAGARGAGTAGARTRRRAARADPETASGGGAGAGAGAPRRHRRGGGAAGGARGAPGAEAAGGGGGARGGSSREPPLVLVLEDLHWSDSATIDLLAMLARRTESARLFVIGTYRAAEVAAGAHPLRSVKQELLVHGRCEELPLELLN